MLASLPEHNPNPVICLDARGRQLYANPAALALTRSLSRAERVRVRRQLRAAAQAGDAPAEQDIEVSERHFHLQLVAAPGAARLYAVPGRNHRPRAGRAPTGVSSKIL
ncbi:MAG: PAS domain-containing protein [Hymenobacter sp.]